MNKIFLISFLIFTSCTNNKHRENLNVVKNNLEAESKISSLFNERNIPLSKIIVEARIDKYKIDKSKFRIIDSLTLQLNTELNLRINEISLYKSKSPDNKFYEATLNYLKNIQELETVFHPFLESIKDTIKDNEQSLSIVVKSKSSKIRYESDNWLRVKSEFYQENKISQKENDSIVELLEIK